MTLSSRSGSNFLYGHGFLGRQGIPSPPLLGEAIDYSLCLASRGSEGVREPVPVWAWLPGAQSRRLRPCCSVRLCSTTLSCFKRERGSKGGSHYLYGHGLLELEAAALAPVAEFRLHLDQGPRGGRPAAAGDGGLCANNAGVHMHHLPGRGRHKLLPAVPACQVGGGIPDRGFIKARHAFATCC